MRTNQFVEITCFVTGEKFLKYKAEYNRQIKNGATRFFKNKEIAKEFLRKEKRERRKHKEIIRTCPCCQKEFISSTKKRSAIYCSRECAAKGSHAILAQDLVKVKARNQKISENNKHHFELVRKGLRPSPKYRNGGKVLSLEDKTRSCVICNKTFFVKTRISKTKTCSIKCLRVYQSITSSANPNCGGETNYRRYRYKGILMDSQWEVDIATWLDEHQIQWNRDKKLCFRWLDEKGKSRRYHPDFYLLDYDIYLDPKNKYLIEKDRYKIETVIKTHGIKIIWGLKDDVIATLEKLISLPRVV